MFIITKNNCSNNLCEVLYVSDTKLQSVDYMQQYMKDNHNKNTEFCIVDSIIREIWRNFGYVWNDKTIKNIYQIHDNSKESKKSQEMDLS